ncbi:MAG: smc 7 [Planctomycetaceae bacterium]|nr:smc 7 [Planctomycetaceae bacterium]
MQNQPLSAILNRLRRRLFAIDGTAGILWGFAGALLWLGIGVWLDLMLELPPYLRVGFLVSAIVVAVGLLGNAIRRALSKSAFHALARQLDQAAGSCGQILSGVELSLAGVSTSHSSNLELTNGLASLAVRQATQLAGKVSGKQVVPTRPVNRSGGSLLLMLFAGLGISILLPRLAATEWQRFSDPFGDNPPFSNTQFEVQPGDAQVVYGTGLEIHVTVNGTPVDGVELVLQPRKLDKPSNETNSHAAETAISDSGDLQDEVLTLFPESESKWRATVANVTAPFSYFVRSKGVRSPHYAVEVITVPQIEAVTFRLTPPAYTRLPTTEGPLPESGISGLPGTSISIIARSNRNLSGGTLAYVVQEKRTELVLKPIAPGSDSVQGVFQITGSGKIEVRVTDEDGQGSTDSYSAAVTQIVDERPFVRLIEPRAVSFATPTAIVTAVIAAEDDYGIARLELYRSLNDSRALAMPLPVASVAPRQTYQTIALKLAEYGLEPGDEIKLFARVEDNDPLTNLNGGTGKGAESTVVVIRIISQEEFDRALIQRQGVESMLAKYQQIRRRMEGLAAEIEELKKKAQAEPDNEKAQAELHEALKKLASKMQDEVESLNKLQNEKQNFALEKALHQELERQVKALQELTKQAESLAQNPAATNEEIEKALGKMLEQLNGERNELEKQVMEPLEMLAQALALKQDESRFVQLYRRQRDLADRLVSLKGSDKKDDPALKVRMRDLETEQHQIRDDLEQLLNDIEEHASKLPERDDLNPLRAAALEFAQAVRVSGADTAMTEAEAALAEFGGTKAHEQAKLAADILEKFIEKNKQMGQSAGGACKNFRPSLGDAMQQSLEELMQASGMSMNDGPGQAMGSGGNGGYSARRSTTDNVGLYGNAPAMLGADAAGEGGSSSKNNLAGRNGRGTSRKNDADEAAAHPSETRFKATSGSEAAIPLRYRRQTGRYFQRLADELGNE